MSAGEQKLQQLLSQICRGEDVGVEQLSECLEQVAPERRYSSILATQNRTCLHVAVCRGQTNLVRCMLESLHSTSRYKLLTTPIRESTPLHMAVSTGNLAMVNCISDSMNNVEQRTSTGGQTEMLEHSWHELLMMQDDEGNTPLHLAAQNSSDILKHFRDSVAQDQWRNFCNDLTGNDGKTLLHSATRHRTVDNVMCIHESFNQQSQQWSALLLRGDIYGNTPLHLAAQSRCNTFQYFKDSVSEEEWPSLLYSIRNSFDETLLHKALRCSKLDNVVCIQQSLEQYSDRWHELLVTADCSGNTPLRIAARSNNSTFQCIIESQSKEQWQKNLCDVTGLNSNTLLHEAIHYANIENVMGIQKAFEQNSHQWYELLVTANDDGDTPVHLAARTEQEIFQCIRDSTNREQWQSLLHTVRNKDGGTPLHDAACSGKLNNVRCIKESFQQYSDEWYEFVLIANAKGDTSLHLAIQRSPTIFRHLRDSLSREQWLNIVHDVRHGSGETLLHIAVNSQHSFENVTCMQESFEQYSDEWYEIMLVANENGDTALHLATKQNPATFRHLRDWMSKEQWQRFLPDVRNNNGDTLLHNAVFSQSFDHITCIQESYEQSNDLWYQLLLTANNVGDTPLHFAAKWRPIALKQLSHSINREQWLYILLHVRDNGGRTLLHNAINNMEVDSAICIQQSFDMFREQWCELLMMIDTNGDTPLHLAAKLESEMFTYLRDSVNKEQWHIFLQDLKNKNGGTLLHDAIHNRKLWSVLCIRESFEPSQLYSDQWCKLLVAVDNNGDTPLGLTAKSNPEIFKCIRDSLGKEQWRNFLCHLRDLNGETLLHSVIRSQQLDNVKNIQESLEQYRGQWSELLMRANNKGETPLHLVMESGSTICTHFWSSVTADQWREICDNNSLLLTAVKSGQSENVRLIRESIGHHGWLDFLITYEDDDGNTPLHHAAHLSDIYSAMRDSLSVNQYFTLLTRQNDRGYTPLHQLLQLTDDRDLYLFRFISKVETAVGELHQDLRYAVLQIPDVSGDTVLHLLAQTGLSYLVDKLLRTFSLTAAQENYLLNGIPNHRGETVSDIILSETQSPRYNTDNLSAEHIDRMLLGISDELPDELPVDDGYAVKFSVEASEPDIDESLFWY